MTVQLNTPRVKVTRASDDKVLEIQCTNADLVLWDRTRIKHKWPKFDEAPFLWLTFISWAGARRSGAIGLEVTYEQWEADVLEANADDSEDEDGAPFPQRQPSPADRGNSASD